MTSTSTQHTTRIRGRILLIVATVATTLLALAAPAQAAVGVPVTYPGHSFATNVVRPNEDKPQSKLWFHDGSWWALMVGVGGQSVFVHELMPDHTWRNTGALVDSRLNSTGDALWSAADGKLFVASRTSGSNLQVTRMSYQSATRVYTVDAGFPVTVSTGGGSESATIDRDSLGRLWVTYTRASRLWVVHSVDDTGLTWGQGFQPNLPDVTINPDDISALIAFGGNIGVLWSDQQSAAFRFAIHIDTDPDSVWRVENALAGVGLADDHINLKQLAGDAQGRIFAAIKTSANDTAPNDPSETLVGVLVRTPPAPGAAADWSLVPAGTVADNHTRPIIMIDQTNQELYFFATSPGVGGDIVYKKTSLANPSFAPGRGQPFVDATFVVNDASGAKDPVTSQSGLVVLAASEGQKRYAHAEMELAAAPVTDLTPPTVPTALAASAVSGRVDLSWTASTDDVGVTGYTVRRDGVDVATVTDTAYADTAVAAEQTYSYTVEAFDAAGRLSGETTPVSATVPGPDVAAPSVPADLAATAAAGRVDLSWSPSTDDVGVTGYTVFRDGVDIATVTDAPYSDTAVTGGQTYSYTVEAFDAATNRSGQSAPASATVPAAVPIALRAVATGANTTAKTLVLPTPASQPGDLLLASVDVRAAPTITAPAGWLLIRNDPNGSAMRKAAYYRISTGPSEPPTYTWGFSTSRTAVGSISAYSGVSTGAPIDAHGGLANPTSKSVTAPSITTTSRGAFVVGLFGVPRAAAVTPPSGMTELSEIRSAAGVGNPSTAETAGQLTVGPGPTGPRVATSTVTGPNVGQLIALRPVT